MKIKRMQCVKTEVLRNKKWEENEQNSAVAISVVKASMRKALERD